MAGSGHYHFFVDSVEQFEGLDGPRFECQSIAMNADGKPRSAGIVSVDQVQFDEVTIR